MPTWTYGFSPASNNLDAVRFWCGDTDTTNQLLQDQEIALPMAMEPTNNQLAAALCCDQLAAKFSVRADIAVGEVRKALGALADHYRKQAEWLRLQAGKLAVPFAGGQSQADKDTFAQNPDAITPPFTVRQIDNPLATQLDNSRDDDDSGGFPS